MEHVVAQTTVDGASSPLFKLHRLLQEKTRFGPSDVEAVEEFSFLQPFQVCVTHDLEARLHKEPINGHFRPSKLDKEYGWPETGANKERMQRLELAYEHLQTILRKPTTAYNQIEEGCLLEHERRHWDLITCYTCFGVGKFECQTCHGQRKQTCYTCNGGLFVACNAYSCFGGRVLCTVCYGAGQIQKTESVWVGNTMQNHTVTSRCTAYGCNGGRLFCQRCSGTGRVNCGTCYATGRITCSTCCGQGEVTCIPCAGTCKVGDVAWLDVMVKQSYRLDLPQDADSDAEAICEKEGGPHGVAAVCVDGLHLDTVTRSVDPPLAIATYKGKLEIAHLKAICSGRQYALTAYGKDLRWLSMNGIVEDLLRRDLADLQSALTEAGEDGLFATRLEHILRSLKHVAASELNADLVESALGAQAALGDHPNVVSPDYAHQVQTGILGSLRFIYTRLAMKHGWQIWVAFGAVGLACWLFGSSWVSALVALCALPFGMPLFERKVQSTLTDALGDQNKASRAMNIARKSNRTRFSTAVIVVPPIVLALLFIFLLPAAGPWGDKRTAASLNRSQGVSSIASPGSQSQRQAVDIALAAFKAGRFAEARQRLLKVAREGNSAAFGPLAWMGVAPIPSPSGTTPEILQREAAEWVDKAMKANPTDLWASAAKGKMLVYGLAMPTDNAGGMRLLHKAADAGHGGAMHELGHIYWNGQRNALEARKWFSRAAALEQPLDMYNLGVFEWYGIGGPRDMKLAMKLWKSAAALGEERAIKAVKIGRPAN
jgi:hypothetical protein